MRGARRGPPRREAPAHGRELPPVGASSGGARHSVGLPKYEPCQGMRALWACKADRLPQAGRHKGQGARVAIPIPRRGCQRVRERVGAKYDVFNCPRCRTDTDCLSRIRGLACQRAHGGGRAGGERPPHKPARRTGRLHPHANQQCPWQELSSIGALAPRRAFKRVISNPCAPPVEGACIVATIARSGTRRFLRSPTLGTERMCYTPRRPSSTRTHHGTTKIPPHPHAMCSGTR